MSGNVVFKGYLLKICTNMVYNIEECYFLFYFIVL